MVLFWIQQGTHVITLQLHCKVSGKGFTDSNIWAPHLKKNNTREAEKTARNLIKTLTKKKKKGKAMSEWRTKKSKHLLQSVCVCVCGEWLCWNHLCKHTCREGAPVSLSVCLLTCHFNKKLQAKTEYLLFNPFPPIWSSTFWFQSTANGHISS